MKDYSLNLEDSKSFILNYEIKNGKIIINFASGDKCEVPFTKKNGKKLLKEMRKQVKLYYKFYNSQEIKLNQKLMWFRPFAIAEGVVLGCLPFGILFHPSVYFIILAMVTISTITISVSIMQDVTAMENIEEFFKNEKSINKKSEEKEKLKENENILSNTSDYTKELVNSGQKKLSLNDIDKMSYSDLKIILDNIKNEERFNFEYPKQEEKKYVKTKY